MLKRSKFTTAYDTREPDLFELEIYESTAFVNILRIGLQTLVPIQRLTGDISNFSSTDPNINYHFFINQFRQIRISKIPQGKLTFYAENKTNGLKPFGTYNLMLNDKPLNLKEYEIDDYDFGYTYPGTYVDFKKIETYESTRLGASEVGWDDIDYDEKKPYDTCNHYKMTWKSYHPEPLKVVCESQIHLYESWKGLLVFQNDGGPYANLVEDYILDDNHECYVRREFYSKNISTNLTAQQKDVDKAIDKIIEKLKKYAKLVPK